jgi:hypothetical protein
MGKGAKGRKGKKAGAAGAETDAKKPQQQPSPTSAAPITPGTKYAPPPSPRTCPLLSSPPRLSRLSSASLSLSSVRPPPAVRQTL